MEKKIPQNPIRYLRTEKLQFCVSFLSFTNTFITKSLVKLLTAIQKAKSELFYNIPGKQTLLVRTLNVMLQQYRVDDIGIEI